MEAQLQDASVGQLLGSLVRETGNLMHQEVRLARTELVAKTRSAAAIVGSMFVGGAVALLGAGVLASAAVFALSSVFPMWLAALVIGGALILAGTLVIAAAIVALKKLDPVPEETVASLKELVSPQKRARRTQRDKKAHDSGTEMRHEQN